MSLFDALKEALPSLPGFQSLSLFGSLAEGCSDEYSDLDIRVITDDMPNAKTELIGVLEQVGPVDFCWEVNLYPNEWYNTVAFRGEGYYKRLDIGLADAASSTQEKPLNDQHRVSHFIKDSAAYVPQYGSMGHFLLGQFIGCLRYLKARKREQTMTCYRFAAALVDWRLALQYARLTGNPDFRVKLSTDDYKEMDRKLSKSGHDTILPDLDFSSPAAMDNLVITSLDRLLEDGLCLAEMLGEVIPTDVFNRISAFIAEELAANIQP